MSEDQRPGSFTVKAMAPMRRRVRALRRLLGPGAAENASFRIEVRSGGEPPDVEPATTERAP